MKIGYARVSTRDQSLQLQVDALKEAGCGKIYQEVASGAKTARVVLDDLINNLREGDTLVIWKLDRLGRNLAHLLQLMDELQKKQVCLISLSDSIDTTTAQGRLIFSIFASLAEFERGLISERTRAGLAAARARGRVGGNRKGLSENAKEKAKLASVLYSNKKIPIKSITSQLNIGRATLYRYLRYTNTPVDTYIKKVVNCD